MNKLLKRNRGFTLIELLVVVAIIGLLASVVLSSLNTARSKSKDALLREQATQMRNLLELEFNDRGSYANLQPNSWANTSAECDTVGGMMSGSTYASQATQICKVVVANSSATTWNTNPGVGKFYLGNGVSTSQSYSMIVGLPYKNVYLCLGSSGSNSETTNSTALYWNQPGCYSNP